MNFSVSGSSNTPVYRDSVIELWQTPSMAKVQIQLIEGQYFDQPEERFANLR